MCTAGAQGKRWIHVLLEIAEGLQEIPGQEGPWNVEPRTQGMRRVVGCTQYSPCQWAVATVQEKAGLSGPSWGGAVHYALLLIPTSEDLFSPVPRGAEVQKLGKKGPL